jgi:hypothetical protein
VRYDTTPSATSGPEYEPNHIVRSTTCRRMIECQCGAGESDVQRHCWTCGRIMVTRPGLKPGWTVTQHAGPTVADALAALNAQRESERVAR